MKHINTIEDLKSLLPLSVDVTSTHLNKGDTDSPFYDALALAINDTLRMLVTPESFKYLLVLSGVHYASIQINKKAKVTLLITHNNINISITDITSPMTIILKFVS